MIKQVAHALMRAMSRLFSIHAPETRDPFLGDTARFRGPHPSDTSEDHDKYLYGEKEV